MEATEKMFTYREGGEDIESTLKKREDIKEVENMETSITIEDMQRIWRRHTKYGE